MHGEILETPISFHLYGKSSAVHQDAIAQAGMSLMNEMWKIVKDTGTRTTGINHWVYLTDGRMFVGVELLPDVAAPAGLEPLRFGLQRYLKHVHVGPYQLLPQKWQVLKAELAARSERIDAPSLEIYGHYCDDPTELETTILIGLEAARA
jgi:hypothetical protein